MKKIVFLIVITSYPYILKMFGVETMNIAFSLFGTLLSLITFQLIEITEELKKRNHNEN